MTITFEPFPKIARLNRECVITDKDNPGFVLDPSLQPTLPKK